MAGDPSTYTGAGLLHLPMRLDATGVLAASMLKAAPLLGDLSGTPAVSDEERREAEATMSGMFD